MFLCVDLTCIYLLTKPLQRRREQLGNIAGVDEQTMELLELARQEREREEEEIQILRERRVSLNNCQSSVVPITRQESCVLSMFITPVPLSGWPLRG